MSTDPLVLPHPHAKRTLRLTMLVIFLTIVGSLVFGWVRWHRWQEDWNRLGPREPSGGIFFQPRL